MLMFLLTGLTPFYRGNYHQPSSTITRTGPTNNPPGNPDSFNQILLLSLTQALGGLDGKINIMWTLRTVCFSDIFRSP